MSSDVYYRRYFSLLLLFSGFLYKLGSLADEDDSFIGTKLGDQCKNNDECLKATANATCFGGLCECVKGFFLVNELNHSFCESKDADETDKEPRPPKVIQTNVDPKMVIIMVVMAVMFVGICVALHLFSKARFRNHRTIFNSPHPRLMHIKLGKKKGKRRTSHTSLEIPGSRQLSICSQLSPLQERRASTQATSPEFSQKTRRSNGEKKDPAHRVSKTDSPIRGAARSHADTPANLTNGPGSPTVIVASNKAAPPNTSVSARV